MSLVWRPSMAIDNGIIDHDHQVLISIVNDFSELKPPHAKTDEMLRTLKRLKHYGSRHLAREMRLQTAVNFPHCKEHEREHQLLASRADGIIQRLVDWDRNTMIAPAKAAVGSDIAFVDSETLQQLQTIHKEIGALLRYWIVEHFIKSDIAMRPYVGAMQDFAATMPSLWKAKPTSLGSNVQSPQATWQALLGSKGWMRAGYTAPVATGNGRGPNAVGENEVIARMRKEAESLGMEAVFDADCEDLNSTTLIQAYHAATEAQNGGKPLHISADKSANQLFLRQSALFERVGVPGTGWRYRARYAGPKFVRIFGEVVGENLEFIVPPHKYARWKMLIDGTLDHKAPLRVISSVEAFGRSDLSVERLLMPFHNDQSRNEEVFIVASYDISFA